MSWRKYFRPLNNSGLPMSPSRDADSNYGSTYARGGSWLPEVYAGAPNRLQRYIQYDNMDRDHSIAIALDTIAEFATQEDTYSGLPFLLEFSDDPSDTESKVLNKALENWCNLNKLNRRIFRIFRSTCKYGDQIFIRDPQTYELYWVDPANIEKVLVNESQGSKIEAYYIKDLSPKFNELTATNIAALHNRPYGSGQGYTGVIGSVNPTASNFLTGNLNGVNQGIPIDAKHIVHISLSEGMDVAWPFGVSILEPVFKVFKQKELLEDSIIIYRVHRAPERRVFFIDVGNMPPHKARQYLEQVRYEVQQKRVPNVDSQGNPISDAAYDPMSMLEDYFFAQTCLSLHTCIPLLDGRTLSLKEIIEEYQNGKTNYVYSQNTETNELEPGKIVWGGVTRENAEVLRVHLDNGEYIDATPDHRFILRNGEEVEAKDLKRGSSLMPLYIAGAKTSPKQKGHPYLRYRCNKDGKMKWVHTSICGKTVPGKDTEIHHIDFNSRNNNPDNLVEMETSAHRRLHIEVGTYSLGTQWTAPEKMDKLIAGIRESHKRPEIKKMLSERNKKSAEHFWSKPTPQNKSSLRSLKKTQALVAAKKKVSYDQNMFDRMEALFDQGFTSIPKITEVLRNDTEFQKAFEEANVGIIRDKNHKIFKPTDASLNSLVGVMGYRYWGDYKEAKLNRHRYNSKEINHRVVRVELLPVREDTGDITIETASGSHIFATAAGVFVHNSDGRGSKVDTLPGGDNLGSIDDLRYFKNELMRGLRVPSSYLPSGPEDGTANYNDGKVGIAYIQEFRFSKFVERLQRQFIDTLDTEFKSFLKFRGIEVDSGNFNISFIEPMNFTAYRELQLDSERANLFGSIQGTNFLSRRFILKRYLGLTDQEFKENEELWREENPKKASQMPTEVSQGDLRGLDIMPDPMLQGDDFGDDMELDDFEPEGEFDPGEAADDIEAEEQA